MSQKELRRSQYLERYDSSNISFPELIEAIGVGVRQWRRMVRDYRKNWPASLVHGLRGKPGNRRKSSDDDRIRSVIREKYGECYPTFVHEKLRELDGIDVSDEKVRQIMVSMGLWKPKTRKKATPPFMLRERRECYGSMQQFDGSYHAWLPNVFPWAKWCLLLAIDDATSRITGGNFCDDEWIANVFPFWQEYFLNHGIPESIYVDRYSTYRKNHPEAPDVPTQFGRVCKTFWTELIFANSPQAKGRVERWNGTLQKRLVAEMKFAGIASREEANRFLKEVYIPRHNAKFAVVPKSVTNMHREIREDEKIRIESVFSVHSARKIQNDYTISFKKRIYQLHAGWPTIFRKEQVRVEERMNGEIVITQRERAIPHVKLSERPKKGYSLPLPPRKAEPPKLTHFQKTGKPHPYMKNFSFWNRNKSEEENRNEEWVAPQPTPH
jgi:hypothetical protein